MTWLEQQVRKASLKQVLLALTALAIVVGGLAFNARYLMNCYQGPYAMPRAELLAAKDPSSLDRYWIAVTGDRVIDAGLSEVTVHKRRGRETGRSTSGYYYVADFGGRFLLVKSPSMLSGNPELKGALGSIKASALDTVVSGQSDAQALRARFLPMQLDLEEFETSATYGLAGAGALALGAFALGGMGLMRRSNPSRHPALAFLTKSSPDAVTLASGSIEADQAAGRTVNVGKYLVSSGYTVKQGGLTFDMRSLDDLLWAYMMVTKKKFYYVIPAGTSYAAHLHFRKGKLELAGKEQDCIAALQHAATHAPWAIYGHTPEIAGAFAKDRLGFIALVNERHAQVMQQRTQPQPGEPTATPQA